MERTTEDLLTQWARIPLTSREAAFDSLNEEEQQRLTAAISNKTNSRKLRLKHASPVDLQRAIDPEALDARHLRVLGDLIVRSLEEPVWATVSISVRMAKSTMIARYGPAFYLNRAPNRQVLIGTNTKDLARDHSTFTRDLIDNNPNEFAISISQTQSAADNWAVAGQPKGGMRAVGVGGSIIGKGIDLGVIDDPFGTYEDAMSPAERKRVWEWITGSFISRIEPGGSLIIVMARWHPEDPVGLIHRDMPGVFEDISIPALAGPDDYLGRAEGEALWPERYDREALLKLQSVVKPKVWACQYQQKPLDDGQGVFSVAGMGKWTLTTDRKLFNLRRSNETESFVDMPMFRFATIDWAIGVEETSDWSVFCRWNMSFRHNLILEKIVVFRSADPVKQVVRVLSEDRKGPSYPVIAESIGIQNKFNKDLKRLTGVKVMNANVGARGSKAERHVDTEVLINREQLFLPSGQMPKEAVKQINDWPNGTHDDVVDTFSMAANIVNARMVGIKNSDRLSLRRLIKTSHDQAAGRQVKS